MSNINGRVLTVLGGMLLTAMLSGCATLGDPGPAICDAPDGTRVPLSDPKCPEEIRRAMRHDTSAPVSVDQSINNDLYNAENGLVAGDQGAR